MSFVPPVTLEPDTVAVVQSLLRSHPHFVLYFEAALSAPVNDKSNRKILVGMKRRGLALSMVPGTGSRRPAGGQAGFLRRLNRHMGAANRRAWLDSKREQGRHRAEARLREGQMSIFLRRREFIAGLGGAAALPLTAHAQQQAERRRRISVLMTLAADDPEGQARIGAFHQGLQELGWVIGRNVQIDYRWGAGNTERYRAHAAELSAMGPDIALAGGAVAASAIQQANRAIPVVFASAVDPVGSGIVASLARPGGNATGFANFEYSIGGKWLELLKQIAPRLTRVAVLRDPAQVSGGGMLGAIQVVAPSFGVEVSPIDVRDADEIERGMGALARVSASGLIVTNNSMAMVHRELIITLAARYRLPATYPYRIHAASGGLISYGPDAVDQYRRAAVYVDRILKGEKPADLPVQRPTKYELVINLKTAKALDFDIPATVYARADEIIE
jgi:putative ABC transport system substrate-binding protein